MMRRWAAVVAALLFSTLGCVFAACGGSEFVASSGADGGPVVVSDGGGRLDAGARDASPASDAGSVDGGGGVQDAGRPVVYVSAEAGSDTNDGLSPLTAKRTLVAAVAKALALDAGVEVHACAGAYAESQLDLNGAVSLRGAYDCTTWARTATFGYPTFDHVNDTIVENANAASQGATLTISGSVPNTNVVDGFTIVGAAALAGQTNGVLVKDEANPVVRDNVITGGAGQTPTGYGSIGVSIAGASSVEIIDDLVNGGTGSPSSVGVLIKSTGTPHVHDDAVSGGLGPSTIGIEVQSAASGATGLDDDAVVGCDSPGATGAASGIQINAGDAAVDIVGSQISGCVGVSDAGASSVGIRVNSPGAVVTVSDNRIFGGARSGPAAYVSGINVAAAGSITVRNSMLHGGEITGTGGASGISVSAVASVSVQDDTVYAGAVGGTSIVLGAGATNVKITDVMVLSAGTGQTHASLYAASCTGVIATLDHDLFVNYGTIYSCSPGDGGAAISATSPEALEALFPNNVATADLGYANPMVCSDDAGATCVASVACPSTPTACMQELFGPSWTADDGITGLFPSTEADGGVLPGGWTLPVGAPCAIAQGGIPVAGVATDLFGNTRTATPTIGAAQLLGTCTP